MPSTMSVSPISHRVGLALALHTPNNSSDLVPSGQPQLLLQPYIESLEASWCQYYASDPRSKNCPSNFQIVYISDECIGQTMRTTLF